MTINNGAAIVPGASPGTLNITGNLTLAPTSTTMIELGGTSQGVDYDFINVTGNVAVDGTLDVSMFGSFTGSVGNTFDVIASGGTMTGSFATVNIPSGYNFSNGIVGGNLYQLGALVVPAVPVSTTPPSISIDEVLVLEENFDSWTLDDIIFAEDTTEEIDDQALICS